MINSLYGQIHKWKTICCTIHIKMKHFDGIVFLCLSGLNLLNPDKEASIETKGRCL